MYLAVVEVLSVPLEHPVRAWQIEINMRPGTSRLLEAWVEEFASVEGADAFLRGCRAGFMLAGVANSFPDCVRQIIDGGMRMGEASPRC